ncbi:cyclase family protein [Paenibacillus sp. P26]|nr:cyclase family protein [Paenibacillus sp. P26]
MKMIDLSVPISPAIREPPPAKIEYASHEDGARQAAAILGLRPEDFPESKAWATETVTLNTHAGTHIDAPWHYWPTSEGRPARTIDEPPLEWFYSDGVVLDFSAKPPGYEITTDDLIAELSRIGYQLKPLDIVLIRSDADKRLYHEHYAFSHAGVSADATLWSLDQGIKVVGTDGWGWDIPLNLQAEAYKKQTEGRRPVGRALCRQGPGILPDREAGQSGSNSEAVRLQGHLLPDQGGKRQRRLGPPGCDCGGVRRKVNPIGGRLQ